MLITTGTTAKRLSRFGRFATVATLLLFIATMASPGRSNTAPTTSTISQREMQKEVQRLTEMFGERIQRARYMERFCRDVTWPGYEGLPTKRCRYNVVDENGTTKTAEVILLNPPPEQIAWWVTQACVEATGQLRTTNTEFLMNHIIRQSGGQFPVAGIVFEDILPDDGVYEVFCFRHGVTVEVEGVPHRMTTQPTPEQIEASMTGNVTRVFRYARIASTSPEEYLRAGGQEDVGMNTSATPVWLKVSRENFKAAWGKPRNELIVAYTRKFFGTSPPLPRRNRDGTTTTGSVLSRNDSVTTR